MKVLPDGQVPDDRRLEPPKDLNGVFPFEPSETPEAWRDRAAQVRTRLRVALGLWPWPTRTPLEAVVHGRVERDGYTVEKVFFESIPGHFVTGSLYRPTGRTGRLPAVLSPHGHWPGGRFQEVEPADVEKELASGAERFRTAAHYPLQARAVHLARMGAIVFLYDMIGYADSVQIPQALAHRGRREGPSGPGQFFGVEAELRLQSIMGLQIWNGIRALDWLEGLSDVDPSRIAITGASGGGTQTMLLGALDERPAVIFPAVMVSTRMQGGCTCENADYLRIGSSNVEIAALFAPKPLGMTAADDWTKQMPEEGYPELQRHYAMLGAPDKVKLFPYLQFGHNYNAVSRAAMYGWMKEHLRLEPDASTTESDFVPLTRAEASVWDDSHPPPAGGDVHEREVLAWWTRDSDRQLDLPRMSDPSAAATGRRTSAAALSSIVGRGMPEPGEISFEERRTAAVGGGTARLGLLQWSAHAEQLPVAVLEPRSPKGRVAVWVHDEGKAGLMADGTSPAPAVRALLDAGITVVGVDLFLQGEFLKPGDEPANRLVTPDRPVAAFTFGYNPPLVVRRVHDVMATLAYARTLAGADDQVWLVGLGRTAAPVAVLAGAVAGDAVDRAALDDGGFRFASVETFTDPAFLPGAVKYGDVPALAALLAAKLSGQLMLSSTRSASRRDVALDAVQWLLAHPSTPQR